MNEEDRELLKSLGWTDELLEVATPSAEHAAVNEWFRLRAEKALSEAGVTALAWLLINPRISVVELAKKLNKGASGFGLEMAIYHEAAKLGMVRTIAKEMLIRVILDVFPDGWTTDEDIHPLVKVGEWESAIASHAQGSAPEEYADLILTHLALEEPPQEGWIPKWPSDPLIDDLFDRYWPEEE